MPEAKVPAIYKLGIPAEFQAVSSTRRAYLGGKSMTSLLKSFQGSQTHWYQFQTFAEWPSCPSLISGEHCPERRRLCPSAPSRPALKYPTSSSLGLRVILFLLSLLCLYIGAVCSIPPDHHGLCRNISPHQDNPHVSHRWRGIRW